VIVKFLILDTDYPDFLGSLYAQHEGMELQPYAEQLRLRQESLYGVADFYARNLRTLGHEAYDIYPNNSLLQAAWAREHGVKVEGSPAGPGSASPLWRRAKGLLSEASPRQLGSFLRRWYRGTQTFTCRYDILMAQIRYHKPDVLLNQAVVDLPSQFLKEAKPYVRFMVGQHAATPLAEDLDLGVYDLMISSFPPTLEYFKRKGARARLSRLGFEPRVLSVLGSGSRQWDISFVGSFFNVHSSRAKFIESVCRRVPQFMIWSGNLSALPPHSPLHGHYMGHAWGPNMYRVLQSSKITFNHHGDVAPFANNMRLFEATGVGTCLLTDWKENLKEMFEPGKEVLTYRSPDECAELIQYYLDHEEERQAIGLAGQTRTLREHTYDLRMQEFVSMVGAHV
jgi:hypothetical protein